MFEKLLSLLLHGKGALVAGVLVAGTAGVVISGTINGANVTFSVTPAASSSTTTNAAATPTPSPLAAAPLLSNSSPTNSTSTSGDTACAEAAHLRNDANLAARIVWTEGRAALDLLVKAGEKGDKKDLEPFKKGLDQARKDAQTKIQQEWLTVACAGKGTDDNADEDKNEQSTSNVDEDKNDQSTSNDDEDKNDDSKTSTTSTTSKTVLNAPKTATPTPKPASNTTTTTTGTTPTNSVEITFDTSKLGRYATFIDDEVTAVNQVLKDAAAATDTATKKDHAKQNGASKKHDGRSDDANDDD